MKSLFFVIGMSFGFGISMTFLLYQASRLPTDRENLAVAVLLRKDIGHIETAQSRQNAIDYALRTSVSFSGLAKWGEVLPPLIQGDTFILRIQRPIFENVFLTLEGSGKLPFDDETMD